MNNPRKRRKKWRPKSKPIFERTTARVQIRPETICTESGKYRYGSESAALATANIIGGASIAYFCRYCQRWHLTSGKGPGGKKPASNPGK